MFLIGGKEISRAYPARHGKRHLGLTKPYIRPRLRADLWFTSKSESPLTVLAICGYLIRICLQASHQGERVLEREWQRPSPMQASHRYHLQVRILLRTLYVHFCRLLCRFHRVHAFLRVHHMFARVAKPFPEVRTMGENLTNATVRDRWVRRKRHMVRLHMQRTI